MRRQLAWASFAMGALSGVASADEEWASRGQVGFSRTSGNTDTTTGNLLLHVAHQSGDWKHLFGVEGLYGSTRGETTAQAWNAHLQTNYNFSEQLYAYGGLRYDADKFSGFVYQETLSAGAGYQFINTDDTKLTGQVGLGVRRLRPEILVKDAVGGIVSATELDTTSDAVLDAGVNFEHALNSSTKVLAAATLESGKNNTKSAGNVALQVKMSTTLALAAGFQVTHNSKPPVGAKPTDTLTTLNLVYEIKNAKLAPE